MRALSLILGILWSMSAFAWPPTYGAEFEFGRADMQWGDQNTGETAIKAKELYLEQVRKLCPECVIDEIDGKWTPDYQVTFPDGWYFVISHDPDVVEITFKPTTLPELRLRKKHLDEIIFGSAKAGGFKVDKEDTAHFNFGALSAFGDNPEDFMRFFIDYQNNTHLALGTLGQDLDNAPPLSVLGDFQRTALEKLIVDVEHGYYDHVVDVVNAIHRTVYTRSYNAEWGGVRHYQALGMKYLSAERVREYGDQPMELRAVWGQKNMENFIRIAELVEARIHFLKEQHAPLRYLKSERKQIESWSEAKTRFYIYVVESGLSYQRYNTLLPREAWGEALADFLNEDVTIEKRLISLQKYADLAQSSAWFRNYAQDLLMQARQKKVYFSDSFLRRIQKGNALGKYSCRDTLLSP